MKENDLLYRTFIFGVNCLKFLKTLPSSYELNVIKVQLSKSSTSIGANYEESQAGSSKLIFGIKSEFPYEKPEKQTIGLELSRNWKFRMRNI